MSCVAAGEEGKGTHASPLATQGKEGENEWIPVNREP